LGVILSCWGYQSEELLSVTCTFGLGFVTDEIEFCLSQLSIYELQICVKGSLESHTLLWDIGGGESKVDKLTST